MLSLKAGGTGLNLTAANHVVLYDRWWNPAVEDQARDRAWRIGQTKTVISHRLVCPGTVDERVEEVVAGKRRIADLVLPSGSSLGDLGAEQLRAALGLRPDALIQDEPDAGDRGEEETAHEQAPPTGQPQRSPARFLGMARPAAEAPAPIRATPDPSAVPRSLGDPPLGPNASATQRHLALVYEEAVRAATALAAANNLLAEDDAATADRILPAVRAAGAGVVVEELDDGVGEDVVLVAGDHVGGSPTSTSRASGWRPETPRRLSSVTTSLSLPRTRRVGTWMFRSADDEQAL